MWRRLSLAGLLLSLVVPAVVAAEEAQNRPPRPRVDAPPPGELEVDVDRPVEGPRRRGEGPPFRGRPGELEDPEGPGPPFMQRLDDEQIERVLGFIGEHFPDRFRELQRLREEDPMAFRRRLRRMMPRIMRMAETFERSPEAGRLTIELERLGFEIQRRVAQYFEPVDRERQAVLAREIRELAARQFDIQQELREQEIVRLERHLESIRMQVRRNAERREERIDQMLEDLGVHPY